MSNKNILKVLGIILFCLILYYYNKIINSKEIIYVDNIDSDSINTNINIDMNIESTKSENIINNEEVTVYVSGEINNIGVYKVSSNLRIIDVIDLAGGVTQKADTSGINMAKIVYDEQHIAIPKKEEEVRSISVTHNGKINLNSATLEQLTEVTHIGEVTAEKIIEYREELGPFMSVAELKNVSGIGDKTFEKIKDNFIVE